MDSLQVTVTQPSASSKTSSRSTSPCRPKGQATSSGGGVVGTGGSGNATGGVSSGSTTEQGSGEKDKPFHPHHSKTLSHGSAESAKVFPHKHHNRHHFSSPNFFTGQSQDGGITTISSSSHPSRSSRHKSPTQLTRSHAPLDHTHGLTESSFLDDSGTLIGNLSQDHDVSDLYTSSFLSNGENREDETDGVLDSKTTAVLEHLVTKIVRVRDLIKIEQKLRDDNVNEYLKLAANADKQQLQRLKAVFEKKNQKSAQAIAQLQKKLETYQKRLHDLREHGIQSHRLPREVLRDMGQGLKHVGGNIRDGITGFSGSVMSKPREFAHLIKNKFGSADNISQFSTWYVGAAQSAANQTTTGSEGSYAGTTEGGANDNGHNHKSGAKHGSATLPMTASQSSMQGGGGGSGSAAQKQFPSDDGSECESSVTSDSIGRYGRPEELSLQENFAELNKKLKYIQEELDGFRENLDMVKSLQAEVQFVNNSIQEDRFKSERLEEQINDLTELHQNEVENLKQAMADMEEKVQYQSEERLRDIHEMLEHCQTKIQKMEHQALQQQQYVMLEGIDNSNARALVVKLINVLLTVLQVVLLLVATGAGIIMPFLRTRVRIITTMVFVIAIVFTLKQWPEVQDIGGHVMKRLKDTLDPVQ